MRRSKYKLGEWFIPMPNLCDSTYLCPYDFIYCTLRYIFIVECKRYKTFFWVLIMSDMQSTSNNKLMKYLQIWVYRRRIWRVIDKLMTNDVLICTQSDSNNLKYCRNFFCSLKADSSNMFNQHGSGQYGTPSPSKPSWRMDVSLKWRLIKTSSPLVPWHSCVPITL